MEMYKVRESTVEKYSSLSHESLYIYIYIYIYIGYVYGA